MATVSSRCHMRPVDPNWNRGERYGAHQSAFTLAHVDLRPSPMVVVDAMTPPRPSGPHGTLHVCAHCSCAFWEEER